MNYKQEYERWLNDPAMDDATKEELRGIAENEKEIEDRFFTSLAFGTGGLRGVIGAGTNRMNIYTVRKATQGLANYILAQGEEARKKGVVIAHDCRNFSPEFTQEAALVLNGNGIHTYVFDSLRPTPLLSFAVRHYGATAGIVITASHNPPEYNGYKVSWDDGSQVPYPRDYAIIEEVEKVKDFAMIKTLPLEEAKAAGLFRIAGADVDDAYIKAVLAQRLRPEACANGLKVVFTPLHGTGNVPVRRVMAEAGYKEFYVVGEQSQPDGNFSTVGYPNPEDVKVFALGIELAKKQDADIILATDPDADRVGIMVRHNGEYIPLNGNMTGALLAEYIFSERKKQGAMPKSPALITTIVSTDMTRTIAQEYGAAYFEVLTGFKYIGEKIREFEESGSHTYLFGFEESYGCLAGTYARDKDAVAATLLICEMASVYKKSGKTLLDALEDMYKKYGLYKESVESITLKGVEGLNDMKRIMASLRDAPLEEIGGTKVTERRDYQKGEIVDCVSGKASAANLPQSDVLYHTLEDGSWLCIRPSGTEPKIKLYFGTVVKDYSDSEKAKSLAEEKLAGFARALKEKVLG